PRHRHRPVGTEYRRELLQRPNHPVRRFVEYHRPRLFPKRFQSLVPSLLLRQKTFETETVRRETALNKRRDESRSSRQRFHLDTPFDTGAHQQKTGVRNSRRPRIGYERYALARFQPVGYRFHGRMLVEFVV